jgi:hypothetical protein
VGAVVVERGRTTGAGGVELVLSHVLCVRREEDDKVRRGTGHEDKKKKFGPKEERGVGPEREARLDRKNRKEPRLGFC